MNNATHEAQVIVGDGASDTWRPAIRSTSPQFWGYWMLVYPDLTNGGATMLAFHESELRIREIA